MFGLGRLFWPRPSACVRRVPRWVPPPAGRRTLRLPEKIEFVDCTAKLVPSTLPGNRDDSASALPAGRGQVSALVAWNAVPRAGGLSGVIFSSGRAHSEAAANRRTNDNKKTKNET